jgi:hypothetical protein
VESDPALTLTLAPAQPRPLEVSSKLPAAGSGVALGVAGGGREVAEVTFPGGQGLRWPWRPRVHCRTSLHLPHPPRLPTPTSSALS